MLEELIYDLTGCLGWTLITDHSRIPIVKMIWENCRDSVEREARDLAESKKRPPKRNFIRSFLSLKQSKEITAEQRGTELKLFDRRKAVVAAALGLAQFYNAIHDERKQRCKEILRTTVARIKDDTRPMPEIDQYLKDFPSFLKAASRSADAMSTSWPFGSNTVDKTISMTQKFASDMNANLGLVDDTQQVKTAPEPYLLQRSKLRIRGTQFQYDYAKHRASISGRET